MVYGTDIVRALALICLSSLLLLVCAGGVVADTDLSDWTIGIYVDEGAHPSCSSHAKAMFRWMGFTLSDLTADKINSGAIESIDIFYFPGGSSPPYIERISGTGKLRLRTAIQNGGLYIGTCAGAMFAAEVQEWDGGWYTQGQLGIFQGQAVGPAPDICPTGVETCRTLLQTNNEHPISETAPAVVPMTYYNSPFLRASANTETHTLASYVTTEAPAVVAQRHGEGWVLLTGPHPEWESHLTWEFMEVAINWCLDVP